MQQSVAYTNLSRSTSVTSTINQHAIPPRKSSGLVALPSAPVTRQIQQELVRGMSPMTADLYDGATTATAKGRTINDKNRKKRPAFLALHNEDSDTHSEAARYAQSRKDREHLRKSSPTVGENFTFLETTSDVGERAMPEPPRHTRTPSLPKNGVRTVNSRQQTRTPVQEEDEKVVDNYQDDQGTEDDDLEEDLDGPPPPPSHNVTPGSEKLDPIREEATPQQPKNKKSTSSVRSQIIGLPEQARLRKQASGEISRQQREQDETPLIPAIKAYHTPSRISSQEALKRRRKSDMTHKHQASDPTNMAYRPRKTPSRSASQDSRPNAVDLRPHPTGPLPAPPYEVSYGHGARSPMLPTSPNGESPTTGRAMSFNPHPSMQNVSAENESWPFTPEMARQTHAQAYLHSPSTMHSRHASESRSYSSLRALSPDATPRPSRSATPLASATGYSYTPNRGRSRSNTGPTLNEDHEPSHLDDSSSITHSVAPSTMSAQWYRSPQERLGLGGRIHRANIPPNWEQMSREEPYDDGQGENGTRGTTPRKAQLFSIYPPGDGPLAKEQGAPDQPPRSPLLTDKFLTDVSDLPPERTIEPAIPTRTRSLGKLAPRRMLSSRQSNRGAEDGRLSPTKRKKESRFPSFGELVTEYKSLANKWYTSSDDVEEIAERPSTSATNLRPSTISEEGPYHQNNGTNPSLRTRPSRDSNSTDSRSAKTGGVFSSGKSSKSSKKKKKPSLFSEMRAEYKSLSNNWYQEAVAEADKEARAAGGAASTRRSSTSG
jgi:hypothetical protein